MRFARHRTRTKKGSIRRSKGSFYPAWDERAFVRRDAAGPSIFSVEQRRRGSPFVREDKLFERKARARGDFATAKFFRQRIRVTGITDGHGGHRLEFRRDAVSLADFLDFDSGHLMNAKAERSRLHHQICGSLAEVVNRDAIRLTVLRKRFSRGGENEHRRILRPSAIHRHETRRSLLEILWLSFASENEITRLFVHRRRSPARCLE